MRGCRTTPAVKVLAVAGARLRLPPWVVWICPEEGGGIVPMAPAGTPVAMHNATRLAGTAPWHGSVVRLDSATTDGWNSSARFGARTAFEYMARNLISGIGSQLPPSL